MQENNFEKQVQQKMGELKIKPSDEVWQKVSGNIASGKRDRRIIAYLFLLFILISSIIFIYRDRVAGGNGVSEVTENTNSVKTYQLKEKVAEGMTKQMPELPHGAESNAQKSAAGEISAKIDIPSGIEKGTQQPRLSGAVRQPAGTSAMDYKSAINDLPDHRNNKRAEPGNKNSVNQKANGAVTVLVTGGISGDSENEKVNFHDTSSIKESALNPVISEVVILEPVGYQFSKDRNKVKEPLIDTIAVDVDRKKVALENPIQTKAKSPWKFGVNFSLGIAATQNGYLGIIGTGNGDGSKAYLDAGQITGSGSNPGQSTNITYTPSEIKPAAGLYLGVFVQRSISTKISLLLGLNYTIYSSSMMIGNKVDSPIVYNFNTAREASFYYSSGNSTSYKNYFHFIELPVGMQFKLSKQNNLPVYLNTGVSIAQLLTTNALQFKSQTGAYYRDNSVFNKTQLNLSAGLLFGLSRQAKKPFLIGPEFKYSVSKMANSGLFKDRHYSYFGILLQKRLGNK